MARIQPRSNIYTALPILATLIMAAGITFTWLRINEYQKPPKPLELAPMAGRQYPDIAEPVAPKKAEVPEDEGEKEKAPDEEPGERAPDAPEKAPEDVPAKEEAPPAPEKAPEKAPEEEEKP